MKRSLWGLLIFLLFAAVMTLGAYVVLFMPNNSMVPAFDEMRLNLVVGGEVDLSSNRPKIINEEIMLPMDTVKKYFDPYIYWDDKLKKVTVTTKDKVIRMKTDSLNALINNKPVTLKIPVIQEKNTVYIPIEFLRQFYSIDITYIRDSNVIVIDYRKNTMQVAEAVNPPKNGVPIRKGHSVRYPLVKRLGLDSTRPEDNTLRVFGEYEKWYKVRTTDGIVGYVEKRYVTVRNMTAGQAMQENNKPDKVWKPEKGKINLVWDMVYQQTPDLSKIGKMEGVDVISPTLFHVVDEKGTIICRASSKYVDWAHKNGYKVWALVSNDSTKPDMTNKILNNTDARDNIIKQLLVFASLYKLDGINIDFENINKSDREALTQFVREVTPFLREQGLVVSIDVTVPDGSDNWSLCYDRKALGEVVDYVMLMTYDQHWAGSPVAGSVAQYAWVENNVKKVLDMVPKEKLLLGLPLYTRLWKEETNGDGKVKVTTPKAMPMEEAKKMIKDNNAAVKWDDESGQFYAQYKKDNAVYKIWLEDKNSLNLKSSLVQKYKLAGTASWARFFAEQSIWEMLYKNVKALSSYKEWEAFNSSTNFVYN